MPIPSTRLFAALTAAFVASAGATAPALAEDVRTMTVDYKDIDLQSADGQKQLDRRIAYAAQQVCAQSGSEWQVRTSVYACQSAARARAAVEIKSRNPGA